MTKKKFTHGFMLIDVDVAALNNAGSDTSTQLDNAVATKKIYKNGRSYVYVSGQAWRYWWRETLQNQLDWNLSPIIREKKVAYTSADPIAYPDDDIFGYMRAARDVVRDKDGNIEKDKKGRDKTENVTLTRVSPLKNSALISIGPTSAVQHWSNMQRGEGDPVPYGKDEYSAVMKGMFSLDLFQVGTFSDYNRSGYKNINAKLREEAVQAGAKEIEDEKMRTASGDAAKLMRLSQETRAKRAQDTLKALAVLDGGAKQATNFADVTPKFLILTTTTSGNHPFSHVVREKGGTTHLDIEALKEVLSDYKDQIAGKVFIGLRKGFLEDYRGDLEELAEQNDQVSFSSINSAIANYTGTLNEAL